MAPAKASRARSMFMALLRDEGERSRGFALSASAPRDASVALHLNGR